MIQLTNAPTLLDNQADVGGVMLLLNGLLLTEGMDFSRVGGQVEMGIPPSPGDVLTARIFAIGRQLGGPSPTRYIAPWSFTLAGAYDGVATAYQIVFGGTIQGVCDGVNPLFVWSISLNRLRLFKNGVAQTIGVDYAGVSTALVFKPGAEPQPGDTLTLLGY
jgi:hypothetical protein